LDSERLLQSLDDPEEAVDGIRFLFVCRDDWESVRDMILKVFVGAGRLVELA
jgi:hypothetical protein